MDCPLDVHAAGTFIKTVWPINVAAATSSVKWTLKASITIKDLWKPVFFAVSLTYLNHIFPYHTIIKRSSIQAISWVAIQRFWGSVRSLIELSVLPGKMIIGVKISPHTALVRATTMCFFSLPDFITVTDLEPFFAKDLSGTYRRKPAFHTCHQRVLQNIFRSLKTWYTSYKNQINPLSTV